MFEIPELNCPGLGFGQLGADLSSEPWGGAARVELRQVQSGLLPEQRTTVYVGRDDVGLRLLFVAEDTHPWATLTERDAPLYTEEVVEVFLDPEGDGQAYFEIEVNPNNAVLDGCMRRIRSGYRKDFRWCCEGLQTAVRRTERGWAAELAIPFLSVTNRVPEAGDTWRANFTRIDRPKGKPRELSAWSPTGLAQFHVPSCFGVVRFS